MHLVFLLFLTAALASTDCGIRLGRDKPGRHKRVIGGTDVTLAGKWPWMISLKMRQFGKDGPFVQYCGGTIISAKWILTAAHCVIYDYRKKVFTVRNAFALGEVTNTKSANSVLDSFLNNHTYRVLKAIPHQLYKDDVHDIALVQLDKPIEFDRTVAPICLPSYDQDIPSDGLAVVTGFGYSNARPTNETVIDEQLRETIVPIVNEEVCETRSTDEDSIKNWRSRKIICAGSIGHDTRSGDSGGPLMMKASDGRWFQIGVTASGHDGTVEADVHPGTYTDVREYCEWIDETTKGEVKCQEDAVELQDVEIKI